MTIETHPVSSGLNADLIGQLVSIQVMQKSLDEDKTEVVVFREKHTGILSSFTINKAETIAWFNGGMKASIAERKNIVVEIYKHTRVL